MSVCGRPLQNQPLGGRSWLGLPTSHSPVGARVGRGLQMSRPDP